MADPISAAVTAIVTSAASATASAALAITGSATFAAAAGNFVLSLASWQTALSVAGFAASFLLTPKVGFEGSPLTWRADVNAGVPFILGRRSTAGSIVHRDEWGKNNRYNTVWSVYSGGGPINSFGQYYLEDVATTFDGTYGTPTSGDYVNKAWLQTTTGSASPGALAQTGLDAATPGYEGWSGSSIMPYRAASMITFLQDSKGKSYPAGEPNKRVTIEGLLCYDPRLDSTVPGGSGSHRWSDPTTWTYSESPALNGLKVAMGIYEGSKLVGGVGAGDDGVDLPAFMEWANVCDANGWVLSAYFTSKDDPHQVLQACMQAGGARYARKGGKISVIARTPKTSVLTIAADDTAGPFELVLNADRLQKVNTVIPRCPQESLEWEVSPQSEVAVSSYVTADGGAIERDIDYPFVALKADGTNRDQPAQLAAYAIVDSREPFSGTIPLKPWCADIEPGDVFTVTEPGFLLDGVELLCVRRQFDPNTNVVNVTFISESSGKHTFALGETNTPPTAPTLTTPDIFTVDAPDVAAFSAVAGTGAQPSIVITADADQINARAFIIDIRIDGVGDWQTFGQYDIETTDVTLTGLEPSTVYEVGIRYVSEFGVVGARLSLGTITTGASVATSISDGIGGSIEWPTIDTRFDDVEAEAEAAQAEIDAARDTLDNTALNLGAALTTEQTRINTAVDDARDEARVQISRLSAPKDNLVLDALFSMGSRDWRLSSGGIPTVDERSSPRALFIEFEATGTGEAVSARLLDEFVTEEGERLEIAAEADIDGVATNAVIRVVWLNSAGSSLSTSEVTLTDLFTRGGGFVTAPTNAVKMRLEIAVDATGAGAGSLRLRRPMWRKADDGQTVLTAFSDEDSAVVSRLVRESIIGSEVAAETRRLQTSDGQNFAAIENIEITQTDGGSALAASIASVEARTTDAEAEIEDLQEAVVVGNLTQARDIQSLKIITRGLNAFDDPTFATGVETWSSTPVPPTVDETGTPRAIEVIDTAAAAGVVATITHGEKFRVDPDQGLELAADFKFSGSITSMEVVATFFDDSEVQIGSAIQVATGGGASYARVGGFTTAPTGTKYAQFSVQATGGTGAFSAYMRRPHFGGQADGQTELTAFDATLRPRTAEALRGLQVDAWRAVEEVRLSVSDGKNQADIVSERETRVANEAAFASQLAAVETTANGALPESDFDTFFTSAVATNQLQSASDVNASIAAIDLTTYATFTAVQDTADAALPSADFDATFATAVAAANLTSTADVTSAITAFDLSLNATFEALSDTVDDKANSSDVYTTAQADQRFLLQADDGGSLAGYDLTLNTDFTGLQATATQTVRQAAQPTPGNYKAGDIWIDTDDSNKVYVHNGTTWEAVAGDKPDFADVFTQAQANARFLLQSDDGGSLAGYDLTLNTDFTGLQDDVDDRALASNVFTKAEANARFLLQSDDGGSLAGYDLTLNTQFSNLASSAAEVVRQAAEPTPGNYKSGDIWIDSDDGSLYVHNGTAWVFANLATQAWANLNFFTASEVDAAIGAYEITVGATTGTIQSQVSTNATAITDINGNLTASYSLTVDGNGRIAGLKLLSDGTTATVAFAADEFRVSDGVTNFVPFEIVSGQVNLQNVSIDGVDINVASVPGSAITVGDVGVNYVHVDSFHDWYSTTTPSSPWYSATNFEDFDFTGDTVAAEPGDRIELLLTYDNVAVLNAYEQFTFQDTMFVEIVYDDGTTGVYHPADETKERYALAARNVGVPPGTAGQTQITDGFVHRKVINTDSGYPWTRTGVPDKTMVGVRIRVQIEARNSGTTGSAVHGGTRSETYVRNSSKLVDVVMSVDVKKQGPINNI